MSLPYLPIFLGLLCAYVVTARWAKVDSRYLVLFALALILGAATAAAALDSVTADTLALFAMFLFIGGAVLMALGKVQGTAGTPDARGGP